MKRHLAYLLSAAALALILVAVMVSATIAATATAFTSDRHSLRLTGGSPATISGLMPGDRAPTWMIELRATGALRYRMHVTYAGSQVLAEALVMTLTGTDGSVLYRGPLALARVGGTGWPSGADPALADGQTATVTVSVMFPPDTGNEAQGASLQFSIVVQSFEDPG
jgi:hypothetical protein